MKIVGIDYSLTSPAVCVMDESFNYDKCQFYFLTSKKKYTGKLSKNITGDEHKEYNDPIKRFSNISDWVLELVQDADYISIEGYSFGSKGQGIFQIAENGGILKYRLLHEGLSYGTIVPSVVKKKATTKGNADKEMMYNQFVMDHNIKLLDVFEMNKLNNPVTDIVDSYYIGKFGYENSKS